jgi:hypothetical protein
MKVKQEEKEKERLGLGGGTAFPFSLVLDPNRSFLKEAGVAYHSKAIVPLKNV